MSDAEKTQPQSREQGIFGSFHLADAEFAVSVAFVQEVVNAPSTYTAVPLAPAYLKGLFNLRGMVIPVVDLRELLGIRGAASSENPKVAIVEVSGACVGLLFDKTGEIFKSHAEERSDFEGGNTDEIIRGVFKKDDGKRIIQILDVSRIKNLPKDSSKSRSAADSLSKKRGNRKQCISFVVGPARCALPMSDIQEILKIDKLNDAVLSGGFCLGTIDLRGSTVPVIDFAALLKYREVDPTALATSGERRVIVIRLENELFGLMVDSVDSIISFFPDELLSFPMVEQSRSSMFLGCITGHGDTDILLLDHQKILSNDEVNNITRGHSSLYRSKDKTKDAVKSSGGARRTYITFTIDTAYAIAINEVKEIIDYPKDLLHPPGLKKHVRGVLNLRGTLVTIVDARSMYLKGGETPAGISPKVLVFIKNGVQFGLVVDSVEAIVTFAENDKIKLPELLYNQGEGSMTADISEAVEVTDTSGAKKSLLIISAEALAERASQSLAA
ncbi:MAG TPA: chemotaxis protein CheW [Bdellovibrionota bacterium]|nr:chemotaxis protein CheW [Bdellovibrionota bacterium]